jgi:transposase
MTYDLKFRRHVLTFRDKAGLSFAQTAARFNLSIQTVFSWSKRLAPKLTRIKPPSKIDMLQLIEDIEKYPDAYQIERAKRLGVSQRCVGYALKRLGVTYKKNSKTSKGLHRQTAYLPRKNRSA